MMLYRVDKINKKTTNRQFYPTPKLIISWLFCRLFELTEVDQQDQFNMEWLANLPWLMKLFCWGTLLLEITYPIGMFWVKTKRIYLVGIVCMHSFIAVFLGLHLFGLLMILFNLSIFGEHAFPGLLAKLESRISILNARWSYRS